MTTVRIGGNEKEFTSREVEMTVYDYVFWFVVGTTIIGTLIFFTVEWLRA